MTQGKRRASQPTLIGDDMNRPWIIYCVFGLCVLVVGGAMAWVSVMVVELDHRDAKAQRKTDLQENLRLALWRMDSALGPIVAQENARPWFEYQAYYNPAVCFTPGFEPIRPAAVQLPSPLLDNRSPLVKLYFQVDENGQVTSPQLPGSDQPWPDGDDSRQQKLAQAKTSLGVMMSVASPQMFWGNAPALAAANDPSQRWTAQPPNAPADLPHNQADPSSQDKLDDRTVAFNDTQTPADQYYKGKLSGRERNTTPQQALRNDAERQQRENISQQGQYLSKINRSNSYDNGLQQQTAQEAQGSRLGPIDPDAAAPVVAPSGVNLDALAPDIAEGPMQARWIGDELVLLRRVRVDGSERVQGVWMNWSAIQPWLLGEVRDLLPEATLVPTSDGEEVNQLATAPIRIIPGALPASAQTLSLATSKSLAVAWGGALLAFVAVTILLRGTLALSERRAAFVSAVTHELRTPLTTFKMYTQMLADGMVPDESARARYLATLRTEADRLGHLVENVLAYARLERHRMAGRFERMSADELIERVGDRLTQRTEQANMTLAIEVDPDAAGAWLDTDAAIVEQVLFNLVDNACKYAPGNGTPDDSETGFDSHRIDLSVRAIGSRVEFAVEDRGPGVCPDAKATLFQPFTKSAQRAAASAPGVGLGLALCRKLTRRIGGDLRLDSSHHPGCRFVMQLPCE